MKAIILAGGYAKRLQPLTNNVAKPLLPIGGRPVIDYIMEKVQELGDLIDEVIIFTNEKFRAQFENWTRSKHFRVKVKVIAEPSKSEEGKLGAIKALAWLAAKCNLKDDCLIIAGDNMFTSSLKPMVKYYFEVERKPVIAVYNVEDLDLVKQYSTVKLDENQKVVELTEKPEEPETTLISTCIYIIPQSVIKLFDKYLKEEDNYDSPGYYIKWLHKKIDVYGYVLQGLWIDIGTPKTYEKARLYFNIVRTFNDEKSSLKLVNNRWR